MRIVLCLLALVAAPVWAEWVPVTKSERATIYIDPASIRKDGNIRKVWEMHDLMQRDEFGEMSLRLLKEYDCKEARVRFLAVYAHSEPMAVGKEFASMNRPSEWDYIPPGHFLSGVLKTVCAK